MITENPMNALERRTVSSLALLYSFRMLGLFMVLPLLSLYGEDFPGASPLLIGLALGIYGFSQALLQIPFGWLSDRIGRKPVIIGGLVLFALGSVVAATADSMLGIVAGRALQGAGAIASTIMALLADLTREEQRTKAMAVVGISIGLSFAVALVVGPLVAAQGGLSAVFYLTSFLAGAGIILVIFRVPTPVSLTGTRNHAIASQALFVQSFRDAGLARLNFGVFVLHFIMMACFLVVPRLLETSAGIEREGHWAVYLVALAVSVVAMLPLMRKAEAGRRPQQMFMLGIGLVVISLLVLSMASGAAALYFALCLFFTGFNYLEATLPSLVSKAAFVEAKGTALGVYSTCQFSGAFAGGLAGGWILGNSSTTGLFALCIVLSLMWLKVAATMGLNPLEEVELVRS